LPLAQSAKASAPFVAVKTSKYSALSRASISLRLARRSSTIRTRAVMRWVFLPSQTRIIHSCPGTSFTRLLLMEMMAHGFEELHDGDRLRKIGLAAALPDFFLVSLHGEGGNRDHRSVAQLFVGLEPFRDLKSRHLGQLNIHQNEIWPVQAREFDHLGTAAGLHRLVPMRLQKIVEQFHVQLIVFYNQNGFLHRQYPVPGGGPPASRKA